MLASAIIIRTSHTLKDLQITESLQACELTNFVVWGRKDTVDESEKQGELSSYFMFRALSD